MLATQLRGEAVHTVVGPLAQTDLAHAFALPQRAALAELGEHAPGAQLARYAELRYQGQEHTLEVPVGDPAATGELRQAFERRCLEAYSFRLDVPLEVVSLRVTATAQQGGPIAWPSNDHPGNGGPPHGPRLVDLDPYGGVTSVPVISRSQLASRVSLPGPCVVEEAAATTLVLPGQAAHSDNLGNLVIEEQQ
jgi:N-methylhydantoinase A